MNVCEAKSFDVNQREHPLICKINVWHGVVLLATSIVRISVFVLTLVGILIYLFHAFSVTPQDRKKPAALSWSIVLTFFFRCCNKLKLEFAQAITSYSHFPIVRCRMTCLVIAGAQFSFSNSSQ